MGSVTVLSHPLVDNKLAIMRNKSTSSAEFRQLLREITFFLGYEATRNLPTQLKPVETPITTTEFPMLANSPITIVPILRAGLGMVDGMLSLLPSASVGHIGIQRNEETHKPEEYFCKLPKNIENSFVIVVDPMLATGGSAIDAITRLKEHGCNHICMLNLVAAPEGIESFRKAHPDVDIYTAAIDEGLNSQAYIVPGLGDAGDRIFNTCE